ncbi:ArsR/SmtB family transcription factor [Paenibacillus sp. 1P07SE]|uniref:ArsR/SmtB family transcription factor n=1 Tax=Paenibacillus sp. 1P07SE TaxID=3132209 RepID=UPI0039A57131
MLSYAAVAEELKLLSDKTRLMILALLKEKEMCVCDIAAALESTQPNISQHLRKLKTGNLVREKRRGQWIYYAINRDNKPYISDILNDVPSMKHQAMQFQSESC